METANEAVAKRMMHREQFPVFLVGYSGKPFMDHAMIPPLHGSIVQNGFDVEGAISAIGESLEGSYLDVVEANRSGLRVGVSPEEIEMFSKALGSSYAVDAGRLVIRGFPGWNTLVVDKNRISPYGDDHYLLIDGKNGRSISYNVPKEEALKEELADEYGMKNVIGIRNYRGFYCENTGWRAHNIDDPLPIFYKNIVIALNNAAVIAKYGKC